MDQCSLSFHALWSCPVLEEIWAVHFAWLSKQTRFCSNFLDILQACCTRNDCFELFAIISSIIWNRRNRLRLGEKTVPLQRVNAMARDSLQEFHTANPPHCGPSPPPAPVKWSPPPGVWVKANFDGALFKELDYAGLGVIIRNDLGLVMAASSQVIPLPASVEMVEVLAARNAICLARDLQFSRVIVEGDSEVVIKALNCPTVPSSSIGHIIRDIKIIFAAFNDIRFCHTRRQGNKVAHSLARRACKFSPYNVWMEDVPPDILSVYLPDLV